MALRKRRGLSALAKKIPYKFEALTFDDVMLIPARSAVLPAQVDTSTRLGDIELQIPFLSAPMDTVTGAELAIALALEGGLGVIHRNMPIEEQAAQVARVKRFASHIIRNPITISPSAKVADARALMAQNSVSGLPVVEGRVLVGIVTQRDIRFANNDELVEKVMTRDVISLKETTSYEVALALLNENRIEKLPIVNDAGELVGLITYKDIAKVQRYPRAARDGDGRLCVGAAIGVHELERAKRLIEAGVDAIVVDSAHGHSENVIETIGKLREIFDGCVVGGNVVTPEGAEDLINAGVDVVKVGLGPGSICTTRIVTGVGFPQLSAVVLCAEVCERYGVPVVADGGIRNSGDIAKAIAAGASAVMIGNLFAGTEESLGGVVFINGRKYKQYRGMGSASALKAGGLRYPSQQHLANPASLSPREKHKSVLQVNVDASSAVGARAKIVPEGVEGLVPYRGTLSEVVNELVGGLKSAMGYLGAANIEELWRRARFVVISKTSRVESKPHDIIVMDETTTYPLFQAKP